MSKPTISISYDRRAGTYAISSQGDYKGGLTSSQMIKKLKVYTPDTVVNFSSGFPRNIMNSVIDAIRR